MDALPSTVPTSGYVLWWNDELGLHDDVKFVDQLVLADFFELDRDYLRGRLEGTDTSEFVFSVKRFYLTRDEAIDHLTTKHLEELRKNRERSRALTKAVQKLLALETTKGVAA